MSSDGVKQVAATYNGNIWYSADTGATWTEVTLTTLDSSPSPPAHWAHVSMSSDGSKVVSAVYRGNIWTSVDSGMPPPGPLLRHIMPHRHDLPPDSPP